MSLIQQAAPDFTAEAVYPDGSIAPIHLADYRGTYAVLVFYPMDFTFVCPTELTALSDRIEEFRSRGAEVLAVSVDSPHAHYAWRQMPRREGGVGQVRYPLVSDLDKSISRRFGVLLDEPAVALRGTYVLDRDGIVRSAMINDLPLGRSVDETLRLLDALRHVEAHGEVCPVNWHAGDRAMTADADGLKAYLRAEAA